MSFSFNSYNEPVLPWTNTRNDERFSKIVKWVLLTFIIFGMVVPWLPSPEAEKRQLKQISPRLAKLITKKRLQKPKVAKAKAVKKKAKATKKVKKKIAKKKKAKAKKKAQQSGLMAMANEIQDLQSMFDLSSLTSKKPLRDKASRKSSSSKKSVISTKANKSSGGIDTSKLSRSTGSTNLAKRSSSKVSSNLGGTSATNIPRRTRSGQNARAIEELNFIFDKYKGALQNIYQRALRKDPSLEGKVVFELTISPAGKVIRAKIISSELGNKKLERRLISRIKSFRFSAKDVATVTVTMPIDFLPS
ncbi:MAG: AgmX/PglI C-terminal domain-containing protein [Woeseiaceae bacterium]